MTASVPDADEEPVPAVDAEGPVDEHVVDEHATPEPEAAYDPTSTDGYGFDTGMIDLPVEELYDVPAEPGTAEVPAEEAEVEPTVPSAEDEKAAKAARAAAEKAAKAEAAAAAKAAKEAEKNAKAEAAAAEKAAKAEAAAEAKAAKARAAEDEKNAKAAATEAAAAEKAARSAKKAPAPTSKPADTPQPLKTPDPVPRFVEFRPGNALNYLFGTLFTIFSVGAVFSIFWAVSSGESPAVIAAVALTVLALGAWWALLNWTPAIVSISNGSLEISRGSEAQTWDLRDPRTELTMTDNPAARSWKASLKDKAGKTYTVTAATVDPEQFVTIVEHYRSGADADA